MARGRPRIIKPDDVETVAQTVQNDEEQKVDEVLTEVLTEDTMVPSIGDDSVGNIVITDQTLTEPSNVVVYGSASVPDITMPTQILNAPTNTNWHKNTVNQNALYSIKERLDLVSVLPVPNQHNQHMIKLTVTIKSGNEDITHSVLSNFINSIITPMKDAGVGTKREILNFISDQFKISFPAVSFSLSVGDGLISHEMHADRL